MSLSSIIEGVIDVAEKLTPLLAGTPVGAAVLAGKAVIDLIDSVKDVASEDEAGALTARRETLEPLVMAHLDRTIGSLG